MPELPEVETTRRGLLPALVGARVVDAVVRERRLRWAIPSDFENAVRGRIIRSVLRRAKYLLIGFDTGTLILHLGMSGSLRLVTAAAPSKKHDHWQLELDNGLLLRFHDPRRFGSLHWTEADPATHPLIKPLGPEPLSRAFGGEYLFRVTRKRSVAIKQLLMNSRLVAGIGNIYASEALFRAGVAPRRPAGRMSRAEADKLARAVKTVLNASLKTGGTTLRDYVNADGSAGYFKQKLFVYERAGEACRVCKSTVKQARQGQRSTYWCSRCQH